MADDILTQDDLTNINTNMARLEEARAQIRKAEAAGLDMTQQKKQVEDSMSQLRKIKNAYFPGQ